MALQWPSLFSRLALPGHGSVSRDNIFANILASVFRSYCPLYGRGAGEKYDQSNYCYTYQRHGASSGFRTSRPLLTPHLMIPTLFKAISAYKKESGAVEVY